MSISLFLEESGLARKKAEEIAAYFRPAILQKHELFVKEGSVNRTLAYVKSGCFQYFTNKDGVELTTYIMTHNNFVASISSFFGQAPAQENIRSLTTSELYLINKDDLDHLKRNNEDFRNYYISVLESLLVCLDENKKKFITMTAEERYLDLMKEEPHLLLEVSLSHLASMLGITQRHLSRIRKSIC